MLRFSEDDRKAVLEAALLNQVIRRAYWLERKADDRTLLNPEVRTATGQKGEILKLEWIADIGGGDAGYIGTAFAKVRYQGKSMAKPRYLTERKVVLRKEFLANWPVLAEQLGVIGEDVDRLRKKIIEEEDRIIAAAWALAQTRRDEREMDTP